MSTPNNDSPPTQPWDEAPARELANRLGSEEPTKFINDRAFILRVCSAIILKFAPPDLTAEVARLKNEVWVYERNLKNEQENYSRLVDRYGVVLEEPEDLNNHLIDPARYIVAFLRAQGIIKII